MSKIRRFWTKCILNVDTFKNCYSCVNRLIQLLLNPSTIELVTLESKYVLLTNQEISLMINT